MLQPEWTIERLRQRQAGTLPDHFGFMPLEVGEGRLVAEMTVQPWMLAPNGYLHAAAVIALADSAAGYACLAHLPDGARGFTTIELKSNFVGTAREGTLRCVAAGEHLGRGTHVWASTVTGPDGRTMALFRCTQMILR